MRPALDQAHSLLQSGEGRRRSIAVDDSGGGQDRPSSSSASSSRARITDSDKSARSGLIRRAAGAAAVRSPARGRNAVSRGTGGAVVWLMTMIIEINSQTCKFKLASFSVDPPRRSLAHVRSHRSIALREIGREARRMIARLSSRAPPSAAVSYRFGVLDIAE